MFHYIVLVEVINELELLLLIEDEFELHAANIKVINIGNLLIFIFRPPQIL